MQYPSNPNLPAYNVYARFSRASPSQVDRYRGGPADLTQLFGCVSVFGISVKFETFGLPPTRRAMELAAWVLAVCGGADSGAGAAGGGGEGADLQVYMYMYTPCTPHMVISMVWSAAVNLDMLAFPSLSRASKALWAQRATA